MCRHVHSGVSAYVCVHHRNLILDSADRKCSLFALPFRFCGAFFQKWITVMESLLQYNIISNITDMAALLLVTLILRFHIGGADPRSDDAQEKSLSTVWSHDPGRCSWSSESATLNSKIVLQLSTSMEKSSSWQGRSNTVMKLPEFYGTPRFSTEFTSVHHVSLTWARTVQSTPSPNPISWRAILIFSSHLQVGLPSGHFPLGCPTNSL